MAKGDILPPEKVEYRQPETDVRVIQLTSERCVNANAYYNHEQFINGSEWFVFISDRTGTTQIYKVEVATGKIVQLTDGEQPAAGFTVDPKRGKVHFGRGGNFYTVDAESLKEELIAVPPKGCTPLGGQDLSSDGRYMVLGCRPQGARDQGVWENNKYRHSSETLLIVVDLFAGEQSVIHTRGEEDRVAAAPGKQSIVYHGPSPENRAAADSHLFIARGDDPSYVWWGSYTRIQPSGVKTMWYMQIDPATLTPTRDPRLVFNQKPYDSVNHYYSAPNTHVEGLHFLYTATDRDDAPAIGEDRAWVREEYEPWDTGWASPYSRETGGMGLSKPVNIPMLLDVDLKTGVTRRWPFPGDYPRHFKCNSVPDMWVGDVADPGFLWFAGRGEIDPPGDDERRPRWPESSEWLCMFKKRGAYLEVRPLVKHRSLWAYRHPHVTFSPDDKYVAWASSVGKKSKESQVFLAEAVWPKWWR